MCRVVNRLKEEEDVYIGRGSIWGNPFKLEKDTEAERKRVIQLYSDYFWDKVKTGQFTVEMLLELDGKRLGCFCKPKLCHGDIIVDAVNWAKTIGV
jgi:hypothetical protein